MGLHRCIRGHAVHLHAASADEILLLGTPGARVKNGEKESCKMLQYIYIFTYLYLCTYGHIVNYVYPYIYK